MIKRIIKKTMVLLISAMILLSAASDAGITPSPFLTEFHPEKTGEALANPYMGWAPWVNGGPYSIPHSLVYINASWRKLEPEKGVYRFDLLELENKFDYWESKNVKIIIRIHMDYPSTSRHLDIPDWLYNETGKDGTWYDISYGKGYSPDYNNKTLIKYHEQLIKAMAERYNRGEQIAFIAIGSLGHWGEFHTWKNNSFKVPFPDTPVSDQYVNHYINHFTEKPLLMRRPFNIAKNNNMGLFNDSFDEIRRNSELLLKTMGYRFIPLYMKVSTDTSAQNSTFTIDMGWVNRGSAPFYFNWPLELSVTNASGKTIARRSLQTDIKSWLPGKEIKLSDIKLALPGLVDGTYSLRVGFINPATGKPEINIPVKGKISTGLYELGKIYLYNGRPSDKPMVKCLPGASEGLAISK